MGDRWARSTATAASFAMTLRPQDAPVAQPIFPNGILVAGDGQSIFLLETWGCSVKRYWSMGPKTGKVEIVLRIRVFPDNINNSSDGNY
jgi:sugar lactone lactonase YvrE